MSTVLNPVLYKRLKSLYDNVIIDHPGEDFNRPSVEDPVTGKRRLEKILGGEMYRIDCPYCPDRTKRLYVSYMFGRMLKDGRKGNFLIHCFNSDCMDDPQNLYEFTQGLEVGIASSLAHTPILRGNKDTKPKTITLPGRCIPLHKLPYHHPANAYLGSRLVDGHRLSRLHGVSYCAEVHNPRYRKAHQRIVVPIHSEAGLIGWQARYVGNIDWKRENTPKYFTCPDMSYSHTMLNLDTAKHWHTGVIVEGWYDRFAVGPMAMPLMGHNLNETQIGKLAVAFRHGAVVYLLDPEEFDTKKHKELVPQLKVKLAGRIAFVRLPGVDPDELDQRDVLWPFIKQEAARQGVDVKFVKRTGGAA